MNFDLKNKGPKACTTCAKAKSRCIPGPAGSDKCERCHRLSKPCASQTPAPPRAKKEPRPTKVAELEKRLNELTSQLHAVQGQPTSQSASQSGRQESTPPSPNAQRPPPQRKVKGFSFDHLFPEPQEENDLQAGVSSSSEGPSPESSDGAAVAGPSMPAHEAPPTAEVPWPSGAEADSLLRLFKDQLEPLFPFVIAPPTLDATQLALKHPFLFKGVMVSALHQDAFRQLKLGDRLFGEVVAAAFTDPHKSLDLLQALQLLVAWFGYNINSFQLTNMLYLCRSMCLTLGFKETPYGISSGERSMADPDSLRAFVGNYYLNTMVFTTSKRPDAFMNPTFLESCCKIIKEKAEYQSDELVVSLFKIMQLAQSICVTIGDNSLYPSMQMSVTVVVQSFQQQLDLFKATLPEYLKHNDIVVSHIFVAQVLLYELAIPDSRGANMEISPSDRLSLLWSCLGAIKGYFDHRFAKNVHLPPRFTSMSASDWLFVTITGVKLHTIDIPGWDINTVRSQYQLNKYVERQISDMDDYIMVRRQGRTGAELVPYPLCKANTRLAVPVFDVYEQIRGIIATMRALGVQEIEQLSQLASARQRERERSLGISEGGTVEQEQQQQQSLEGNQMLRDLDGTFWEMFDDPSWMLGIDTSSMEWTSSY